MPAEKKELEEIRHDLNLLEAALYVSGRPLTLKELGSVLKTRSKRKVRNITKKLVSEYSNRNSALEILKLKDERYVLQLKTAYSPSVKKLVNRPLLSSGPLKTISLIAYKQPISQKQVVDARGRHAYSHIKLLKEMGLIAHEKNGRSQILRTTEYFSDYFGLSHDISTLKKELKHIFEDFLKQDPPTIQG